MSSNRYSGIRKMGTVVEKIAEPAFKNHGFANQKLITYWPQIIGATLAKFTIPQKISFPPHQTRGGVLYIGVTNPGLSLEIQAQESMIIEKISTFFGYQAVSRIKVCITRFSTQEEKAQPAVKQTLTRQENEELAVMLETIEDEELQKQLKLLAASLFTT